MTAQVDFLGTTTENLSSSKQRSRLQTLAGEKLFAIYRWVILIVLLGITSVISQTPLWVAPLENIPVLVLGTYVVASIILTVAVFVPFMYNLLKAAMMIDITFLALFILFSGQKGTLFYPVFVFPLIGFAVRQKRIANVITGGTTAIAFVGAALIGHYIIGQSSTSPHYALIGLTAFVLALLPVLTGSIVEQWSAINQQSINAAWKKARQQSEHVQHEVHMSHEREQLLYHVASSFARMSDSSPKQTAVLDAMLKHSQQLVPYTHAIILLKSNDPDKPNELHVETGFAMNPGDPDKTITMTDRDSTLASLLQPGTPPTLLKDIAQDPDLQPIATIKSCTVAWVVPLQFSAIVYGVLIMGSEQAESFNKEQRNVLHMLAQFSTVALHNGALLAELEPYRKNQLRTEKQAREELTRYVHDGLAQTMAQIVMNADFIKRMVAENPDEAMKELDNLHQQFKRYHFEVREVLTALSPLPLGQGLYIVLNNFLDRKRSSYTDTEIILEAEGIKDLKLNYEVENMLYNIVQESVNNALKYAEAKHIWVRCKADTKQLTMTILDDGKGFDVEEGKKRAQQRGSFGLFNIGERARLAGGSAELHSKIGKGTFIRVFAPVEQ